jgi:hypothetical protein
LHSSFEKSIIKRKSYGICKGRTEDVLEIRIFSFERNMLIAVEFSAFMINRYREHAVSTDDGIGVFSSLQILENKTSLTFTYPEK